MRLNGWQRLWVVVSLAWGCVIAAACYVTRPTEEFAPHRPAFEYQLAPESRALLLSSDAPYSAVEGTNNQARGKYSSTLLGYEPAVEVEMPNGHVMRFRADSSQEDQERVAREYSEIAMAALAPERIEHIQLFALLAVLPSLVLLVLGLGIAWVRSGFRESKHVEQ